MKASEHQEQAALFRWAEFAAECFYAIKGRGKAHPLFTFRQLGTLSWRRACSILLRWVWRLPVQGARSVVAKQNGLAPGHSIRNSGVDLRAGILSSDFGLARRRQTPRREQPRINL